MTDPVNDGDLQALWQSQALDQKAMSLEEIRAKAKRLERIVARRNRREYVGAVVGVAGFGWIMWVGPSGIIRVGAGLFIVAVIFVVYRLHSRGSTPPLPAELGMRSALEFHCLQLVRQRDLLRSVWWWYLLPLLPGMLVVQIGRALVHPERLTGVVIYCVVVVGGAAGIHELNRRAAARIQERIDRLNEKP
jgi:hypothetical protein